MRRSSLQFIVIALCFSGDATPALEAQGEVQSIYTVVLAEAPPVIDGNLDDAIWQKTRFQEMYEYVSLAEQAKTRSKAESTFAFTADSSHLYVAYRCHEPVPGRLKKSKDKGELRGNVELFLNYDQSKNRFIRLRLSANGELRESVCHQFGLNEVIKFSIKGLTYGIKIYDDHWTVELALPFSGLGVKPGQGGPWGINACRVRENNWELYSWGLHKEKPKFKVARSFTPMKIIRASGVHPGIFSLFRDVAGIPAPVYTAEESAQVETLRLRWKLDQKPEDFLDIVPAPTLPLESLMFYTDDAGQKQPITTAAHRKLKRMQILEGMQKALGTLPARPKRNSLKDFDLRVTNTKVRGTYTRKTIHFFVAEGEEVHAFLYEPLDMKPGEKRPAVIGLQPTGGNGKYAFEIWPKGMFPTELAMMGYVVIVPDFPSFGESADYDFAADRYASGPLKGIYNHMSCIDLLQALPNVDPDRIGAIGHSLGGQNTVYLAAFDERVKIAVSSCGWTTFRAKAAMEEKRMATEYYMPRLKSIYKLDLTKFPFEYTESIAAIAPRIFFSNSPKSDGVHPSWGPRDAAPVIREYFAACGAEKAFKFHMPADGHDFLWPMRQLAYRTMHDTFNYHPHGDLGLLAERQGKEAVPQLLKALNDPLQKNRWVAAHHLGLLGNTNGLARMQKDLKALAPQHGSMPSTDAAGHDRLKQALEVALVLAKLGDASGFELASNMALKGPKHFHRWRASEVLTTIANGDGALLKAQGKDPIAVLKTMAAEEKDYGVFFVLVGHIHKILRDRSVMIEIIKIAKDNKDHTDKWPGHKYTMAERFYRQVIEDKDKPYDFK